jgi:hypothetical protein
LFTAGSLAITAQLQFFECLKNNFLVKHRWLSANFKVKKESMKAGDEEKSMSNYMMTRN